MSEQAQSVVWRSFSDVDSIITGFPSIILYYDGCVNLHRKSALLSWLISCSKDRMMPCFLWTGLMMAGCPCATSVQLPPSIQQIQDHQSSSHYEHDLQAKITRKTSKRLWQGGATRNYHSALIIRYLLWFSDQITLWCGDGRRPLCKWPVIDLQLKGWAFFTLLSISWNAGENDAEYY